jgi:CRISPR-associated protein Csm4
MRVKINRDTGTTGTGFDPFANVRFEYAESSAAALYVLLDTERLESNDVHKLLMMLGKTGFGKDATIGRGQFSVRAVTSLIWDYSNANGIITLSPSVLTRCKAEAFYEPFTRWGKHGDHLANGGNVWKNPILMADTFAAVMGTDNSSFIGKGLGGDGSISHTLPETVHQGYAIGLPVSLDIKRLVHD